MSTEIRPFLSVREVAALLNLHRATVYRYIYQGKLTAVIVGQGYRIHRESLKDLVSRFNADNRQRLRAHHWGRPKASKEAEA